MKSLLVIGAGGHGRVVKEIAQDIGYEKIDFGHFPSRLRKNVYFKGAVQTTEAYRLSGQGQLDSAVQANLSRGGRGIQQKLALL